MPAVTSTTSNPHVGVLIVEDEAVARKALSVLLSSYGFITTACGSAEEALGLIRNKLAPEFALVDLDLPGMNGLDFIGRLRESDRAVFPVLITAADKERVRSLDTTPVRYLQKPLDFEKLLILLHECQARH
ncbi:MAG TPA: response regulator [Tepidisphaeraceae bacterium]|nr:response regulator [Tepidisphaeraceae bacterium]